MAGFIPSSCSPTTMVSNSRSPEAELDPLHQLIRLLLQPSLWSTGQQSVHLMTRSGVLQHRYPLPKSHRFNSSQRVPLEQRRLHQISAVGFHFWSQPIGRSIQTNPPNSKPKVKRRSFRFHFTGHSSFHSCRSPRRRVFLDALCEFTRQHQDAPACCIRLRSPHLPESIPLGFTEQQLWTKAGIERTTKDC